MYESIDMNYDMISNNSFIHTSQNICKMNYFTNLLIFHNKKRSDIPKDVIRYSK